MLPQALLDLLAELAQEAGMRVKVLASGGARPGDLMAQSGACRVRGEIWVILAADDPLEDRIEALADALRTHAAPFLEDRFLPPAVRERLER